MVSYMGLGKESDITLLLPLVRMIVSSVARGGIGGAADMDIMCGRQKGG